MYLLKCRSPQFCCVKVLKTSFQWSVVMSSFHRPPKNHCLTWLVLPVSNLCLICFSLIHDVAFVFLESSVALVWLYWLFLRILDLPHYFHLASYALLLSLCLSCWLFYHNIMPLQAFSLSVISLLFELFFELIISFVLHSPVLWFFHYFEILNSVSSVLYLLSLFCFVSFFCSANSSCFLIAHHIQRQT